MKTLLTTVSFILAITLSAVAADKPKFFGEVTAVDAKAKTLTIYEGPTKSVTYTVTDKTRILVNEKKGTFGEIKDGMKASVTHKEGSNEADLISAETTKKPRRLK